MLAFVPALSVHLLNAVIAGTKILPLPVNSFCGAKRPTGSFQFGSDALQVLPPIFVAWVRRYERTEHHFNRTGGQIGWALQFQAAIWL
jgi:hypothetical protein